MCRVLNLPSMREQWAGRAVPSLMFPDNKAVGLWKKNTNGQLKYYRKIERGGARKRGGAMWRMVGLERGGGAS